MLLSRDDPFQRLQVGTYHDVTSRVALPPPRDRHYQQGRDGIKAYLSMGIGNEAQAAAGPAQ